MEMAQLKRREIPRREIPTPRGRPRKPAEPVASCWEVTRIFYANQAATSRIVINRGGAGSSKTYSIMQLLLYKIFQERNKRILILRKTLPSVRTSVMVTFADILEKHELTDLFDVEKVHLNYKFNNNLIHFGGMDDPEKVKSSEWNYIWVEEATEFDYEDFRQLKLRLRRSSVDGIRNQMFLSFNPIDEYHWIKEKVVDEPTEDATEIHSTYRDNPFLDVDAVLDIENLVNQDLIFHNVYALGLWGRFENLIYQEGLNWDKIDYWPTDLTLMDATVYGLDFGFNKEAGMTEILIKGKEAWERQIVYEKKLTNQQLIERVKREFPREKWGKMRIWADSAEPDRIKEFKEAGFSNIKPAEKNVMDSINAVKSFRIHVFGGSTDLLKEKRAYSWRTDRHKHVLDEPVDYKNHLMDPERYALYNYLKRKGVRLRVI
jgi:phage terminase large subunit